MKHLLLFIKCSSTSLLIGLLIFSYDLLYGQNIDSLKFPLRGAFYYSWYPETWTVNGKHVSYNVELGYYNSNDTTVVKQHIKDLDYAGINVAIASWWAISQHNQAKRIPMLLDQTIAAGSKLKWAFYYEMEGFSNPTVDQLKADLAYLKTNYTGHKAYAHINGKPVIFVYNADDNTCEVADRWAQATNGEWYVNLKVFGGFMSCANQPDSWHQYGPGTANQEHKGYSYVISPGFWRADMSSPLLTRNVGRWNQNVRDMIASGEPWQLITTFNEWGEGTAIERCLDWASESGYGAYLDALHRDGDTTGAGVDEKLIHKFDLNYFPNPNHSSFTIHFNLPEKTFVALNIYDSFGRRIHTLINSPCSMGIHEFTWIPEGLQDGIYFSLLQIGDKTITTKLLFQK